MAHRHTLSCLNTLAQMPTPPHPHTLNHTIIWRYFTLERKKKRKYPCIHHRWSKKIKQTAYNFKKEKITKKKKKNKLETQNCVPWLTPMPVLHANIFHEQILLPKVEPQRVHTESTCNFSAFAWHDCVVYE